MTTGVRGESVEAYHLMARTPHTVYRTGPERSGGSELRLSSRKGNRQVVTSTEWSTSPSFRGYMPVGDDCVLSSS